MTIDEAIRRSESIAKKCMEICCVGTELYECGKDHEQIAEWLKELKNRREVSEIEKRAIKKCDKCSDIFDCPLYYPWLKE